MASAQLVKKSARAYGLIIEALVPNAPALALGRLRARCFHRAPRKKTATEVWPKMTSNAVVIQRRSHLKHAHGSIRAIGITVKALCSPVRGFCRLRAAHALASIIGAPHIVSEGSSSSSSLLLLFRSSCSWYIVILSPPRAVPSLLCIALSLSFAPMSVVGRNCGAASLLFSSCLLLSSGGIAGTAPPALRFDLAKTFLAYSEPQRSLIHCPHVGCVLKSGSHLKISGRGQIPLSANCDCACSHKGGRRAVTWPKTDLTARGVLDPELGPHCRTAIGKLPSRRATS